MSNKKNERLKKSNSIVLCNKKFHVVEKKVRNRSEDKDDESRDNFKL